MKIILIQQMAVNTKNQEVPKMNETDKMNERTNERNIRKKKRWQAQS